MMQELVKVQKLFEVISFFKTRSFFIIFIDLKY